MSDIISDCLQVNWHQPWQPLSTWLASWWTLWSLTWEMTVTSWIANCKPKPWPVSCSKCEFTDLVSLFFPHLQLLFPSSAQILWSSWVTSLPNQAAETTTTSSSMVTWRILIPQIHIAGVNTSCIVTSLGRPSSFPPLNPRLMHLFPPQTGLCQDFTRRAERYRGPNGQIPDPWESIWFQRSFHCGSWSGEGWPPSAIHQSVGYPFTHPQCLNWNLHELPVVADLVTSVLVTTGCLFICITWVLPSTSRLDPTIPSLFSSYQNLCVPLRFIGLGVQRPQKLVWYGSLCCFSAMLPLSVCF